MLMTMLGALLFVLLHPSEEFFQWLALFFFLDNLLVFTVGAMAPIGFNDRSTLLAWRGKK